MSVPLPFSTCIGFVTDVALEFVLIAIICESRSGKNSPVSCYVELVSLNRVTLATQLGKRH